MSGSFDDLPIPEARSLQRGRFTYFPVVPGRLEFAVALRRAILQHRPRVVAVELPGALEAAYRQAVARLPEMSVLLYSDGKEDNEATALFVPVEPADPFTEAVRSGLEVGAELLFVEPSLLDRPHVPSHYPDPYAVRRVGLDRYVDLYRVEPPPRTEELEEHAQSIAWRLQGTDPLAPVMVVVALNLLDAVLDAMEAPQEEPARGQDPYPEVRVLNPHPDCLAEITIEYPYLQDRYEQYRFLMEAGLVDRLSAQWDLLRGAQAEYEKNTGDKMHHWQRRLLAKYTRNLAMLSHDLVPGLFDLTVAARGIVDDNYAWEVWNLANRYPAQKDRSVLETVNLSADEIWLNTKRLRLRRRLPRPKQRSKPANLKMRRKEHEPGEWAQQLNGEAICSYPPEDLVIEEYGRFLKQKVRQMLTAERERTEPFSTSMLDGIDLRETIRHWHERRIFVKRTERASGNVGSVVVIFDEDPDDRYRYLTTWLGEHQNESDMAFYSTYPFDHLVGPGIGRAEYGGYLMSLPARRMYDVWGDPDYEVAENKPERLLLAALDYSVERYVVYVAAKPPRSIFRSIAAHLGRQIVYIPIGQLSPTTLKKVRVVHVLDGHERRKSAKEYLW